MANFSAPSGASPVRNGAGNPWNQQGQKYYIPASDNNQYNIGDFVKSIAGADTDGVPQCVKAAAGNTCRGVIVGVVVGQQSDPLNIPATKARDYYVLVCDDPDIVMEMTDDGITTANLVATAVGKNANFTVTNPTAPSPVSASVLNSSTFATTNTLPLKILGLRVVPGNTIGAFARWLVRFNTHEMFGNTTGV